MSGHLPGYKEYVEALTGGRLEDAKHHLIDALVAAKAHGARPVIAGFAQGLASILFKQGDSQAAIALYELSEELDSGSLLAKLDYAKFLANELQDKARAMTKCREIIDFSLKNPFPETEGDFSSENYREAAERIVREITLP